MAKCITSGQLHFVDCLTQLLANNGSGTSDLDPKSSADTSAPLKSYSVDPKSVKQHNITCVQYTVNCILYGGTITSLVCYFMTYYYIFILQRQTFIRSSVFCTFIGICH